MFVFSRLATCSSEIEYLFWALFIATMHSISIAKKQYIAFLVLRYEFFLKPGRLYMTFHSLACDHIQIKAKKVNDDHRQISGDFQIL